jgi:purine-binding chemotaxis protein CheW
MKLHHSGNGHSKKLTLSSPLQTSEDSRLGEKELSPAELAEIWARRAYNLAEPPPAEASGQTLDLLVFRLSGERYGLEVAHVREIYPLEQLTRVPRTPNFVVGIFSARGRLISVIDLRLFLGLPASPDNRRKGGTNETKIIVVATDDLAVGLLADDVSEVLTVFKDELEPALTSQMGNRTESTLGIAPGMLVALNLKGLLSDKRLIVSEELL